MLGLVYSRLSQADLEEIWNYIAFDSERQAEAVLDRSTPRSNCFAPSPACATAATISAAVHAA